MANAYKALGASAQNVKDLMAARAHWSTQLLTPVAEAAFVAGAEPTPSMDRNVVGLGIGEKIVGDRPTGELALKFLVQSKFDLADIPEADKIPETYQGLPVDVEEVGEIIVQQAPTPGSLRLRVRPAHPGLSIGPGEPMAGTFGALVQDAQGTYVLSNNHVLALVNRLLPGAAIYQQGILDGGQVPADQIATLTRFIKLQALISNRVDAAIARVSAPGVAVAAIPGIGAPTGKTPALFDMMVHKLGRTTGYTVGRITSVDTDIRVNYREAGVFTFTGQLLIESVTAGQPFSQAGDSGSLILARGSNKAVGLLFAGSNSHTIANPISRVLQRLKVKLV